MTYSEKTFLKKRNKILLTHDDFVEPHEMVQRGRAHGVQGNVTVEYVAYNDREQFIYAYTTYNAKDNRLSLVIPHLPVHRALVA